MFKHWLGVVLVPVVLMLAAGAPSGAQSPQHAQWVGTWAASPMLAISGFAVRPFAAVTLREVVHISSGGEQIRVRFTNEFGLDGLTIADAHVAVSAGGAAIKDGTDHAITFGGQATVRIPPGAAIYSDPVALAVAPLSDVAVSFYLPSQVMRGETYHAFADQDNFVADGDQSTAATILQPATLLSWYFLDGIDVNAVEGSRAIVTLGDSITDGAHSTANTNRRWPDVLAARLKQEHGMENVSVLNEGIGGNRVLNDQAGPSALARMNRDVLAQNGVRAVIVLESINDIGRLAHLTALEDDVTAQQLEHGLKQIADAAHEHGIKAFGATLTPYGGAAYNSERGERVREDVNNWIRSSGTFDGVIDFDQITRDPQNPDRFLPAYDSGDHLHPSDAGYKAMGEGIDLKMFK
ncbi:MAG TPA: SGNH/GDSL hydrolase family protein [Terracidiphilus sp.]|nr:SGNH/GDSL hydrolase family protein [Terracidiphilus sp.]